MKETKLSTSIINVHERMYIILDMFKNLKNVINQALYFVAVAQAADVGK